MARILLPNHKLMMKNNTILSWFFSLICFASIMSCHAAAMGSGPFGEHLHTLCGYVRYPKLCVQTMETLYPSKHIDEHFDIISALINMTISESKFPVSNFEFLSSNFISHEAQSARMALGYCHELMEMAVKRLNQAMVAVKQSPRKNKQDIQTWISAALTYQEACKDGIDVHAISNDYLGEVSKKMEYLAKLGSNSLALVNRITSTASRRLSAAGGDDNEQEFPSWVPENHRKLLQQSSTPAIRANAVVAKDGTGNYKTISDAIKAASGGRFVIYVKSGVYREKIYCNKDGITLIGDGKYSTVITGDDSIKRGFPLPATATFTVSGDGFIAKDIGFYNTAGPGGEQAVALSVASDHSVFYRCSIAGYQDTLYALALRQFYRECDIYGTIDFIFGNAAAIFQNCQLVLRRPGWHGSYNVILANGRSDPGQNTGFSVHKSRITVGSDFSPVRHLFNSYLGRPWKLYSRSVVMESTIDEAIAGRGWIEWPGSSGSSLKSLYFAEYANMGPGCGIGSRVKWPGYHVITKEEANRFTVANFIGGTSWLPSTGVTFISGL